MLLMNSRSRRRLLAMVIVGGLLALSVATGPTGVAHGIVNGTNDTNTPAANAVVKLENSSGSSCTGTLISPDEVLTAGHCIPRPGLIAVCVLTARRGLAFAHGARSTSSPPNGDCGLRPSVHRSAAGRDQGSWGPYVAMAPLSSDGGRRTDGGPPPRGGPRHDAGRALVGYRSGRCELDPSTSGRLYVSTSRESPAADIEHFAVSLERRGWHRTGRHDDRVDGTSSYAVADNRLWTRAASTTSSDWQDIGHANGHVRSDDVRRSIAVCDDKW